MSDKTTCELKPIRTVEDVISWLLEAVEMAKNSGRFSMASWCSVNGFTTFDEEEFGDSHAWDDALRVVTEMNTNPEVLDYECGTTLCICGWMNHLRFKDWDNEFLEKTMSPPTAGELMITRRYGTPALKSHIDWDNAEFCDWHFEHILDILSPMFIVENWAGMVLDFDLAAHAPEDAYEFDMLLEDDKDLAFNLLDEVVENRVAEIREYWKGHNS